MLGFKFLSFPVLFLVFGLPLVSFPLNTSLMLVSEELDFTVIVVRVIMSRDIIWVGVVVRFLVFGLFGFILDLFQSIEVFLVLGDLLGESHQAIVQVEIHLFGLMFSERLMHGVGLLLHHKEIIHVLSMTLVGSHAGIVKAVFLMIAVMVMMTMMMFVLSLGSSSLGICFFSVHSLFLFFRLIDGRLFIGTFLLLIFVVWNISDCIFLLPTLSGFL